MHGCMAVQLSCSLVGTTQAPTQCPVPCIVLVGTPMQNQSPCKGRKEEEDGLAPLRPPQQHLPSTPLATPAPSHTSCQGGVYHGRILLPPEYPFKPPAFMMLTPSGRFETGVKICLSISSHHPEHWQPSWSVRTALTALIAFMPSPGQGALGSLVGGVPLGPLGGGREGCGRRFGAAGGALKNVGCDGATAA